LEITANQRPRLIKPEDEHGGVTVPLIGQALNGEEILANERPRLIKPEDEHGGVTLTSYWSGSKLG
jgi:hypothetical protein